MNIVLRAVWIFTLCLSSSLSWAQQTLNVSFGCEAIDSTYEIWLYNSVTPDTVAAKGWDTAQAFAADRKLRTFRGHLATFESAEEESCVLEQAAGLGLTSNQQLWIGLVQNKGNPVPNDDEPELNWGWVTDGDATRGWEPGDDVDSIGYQNWGPSEPNDAGGSEDHGTIGRYGYTIGNPPSPNAGWNDEIATRGTLYGMVIEYDVAALGEMVLDCDVGEPCEIQIPSANPENNTITLPTGAGGTADIGVFLIEEECSDLDMDLIYDSREVFFGLDGESIPVANYLCADQWILISSELEDVFIDSGVVEAEFVPSDFGLVENGCAGSEPPALNPNPIPLADPLKTDLVTYLPGSEQWGVVDNPSSSPGPGATSSPRSDPWMQDFTYACGSSLGRMAGNRYFGIGLNFYFMGDTFAIDPDGIKTQLIGLTRQKLVRMLEWVADARTRKVIKQGDFRKMEEKLEGAIANIDQMEFDQARQRVADLFDKFLDAGTFKVANASGHNFQGEGKARSSNVLHMLDVYILPDYPL